MRHCRSISVFATLETVPVVLIPTPRVALACPDCRGALEEEPLRCAACGRVFEIRLDGVKSGDGDAVVHPEAYYTLNEFVK